MMIESAYISSVIMTVSCFYSLIECLCIVLSCVIYCKRIQNMISLNYLSLISSNCDMQYIIFYAYIKMRTDCTVRQ